MKLRRLVIFKSLLFACLCTALTTIYILSFEKLNIRQDNLNSTHEIQNNFDIAHTTLQSKIEKLTSFAFYFADDFSAQKVATGQASGLSYSALYDKASKMMELSKEVLYFQILSLDGQQLFRLERKNEEIARIEDKELKDLSNSDFFSSLQSLGDKQSFISNFDLDKDDNGIKEPHTPLIRFAAPIVYDNNKAGYVIVNADATDLLNQFTNFETKASKGNSYLINSNGEWINGHKDLNWAHLLEDTKGETFAKYFPTTFAQIRSGKSGITSNPEGAFYIKEITHGDKSNFFVYKNNSSVTSNIHLSALKERGLTLLVIFVSSLLAILLVYHFKKNSIKEDYEFKKNKTVINDADKTMLAGHWNHNLQSKENFLSQQTKEIFRFAPETSSISLANCFSQFVPESEERIRTAFSRLKNHMKPFDLIEKLKSTDNNETVWIRVCGQVQEVRQGKVVSLNGIFQDVSTLKSSEEKLRLTQKEQLETQKNSELGEMAAAIIQEISNPLSIIKENIEYIQNEPNAIGDNENIKNISEASDRIQNIIFSLRKLSDSKLKEGLREEKVSNIFDDARNLCQYKIKNLGVDLRTKIDGKISLKCNVTQISQIIANLINNSCDAIKLQNDPWIEIETKENDLYLEISISDSGNGIDKEIQDKIFQSFFTNKSETQSNGYSLYISKKIAREHGGDLSLNTNSTNTCFVLKLPIIADVKEEPLLAA